MHLVVFCSCSNLIVFILLSVECFFTSYLSDMWFANTFSQSFHPQFDKEHLNKIQIFYFMIKKNECFPPKTWNKARTHRKMFSKVQCIIFPHFDVNGCHLDAMDVNSKNSFPSPTF